MHKNLQKYIIGKLTKKVPIVYVITKSIIQLIKVLIKHDMGDNDKEHT